MSKHIIPLTSGSLTKIIDSSFQPFFDEFFKPRMPIQLIEKPSSFPKYNIVRENKDITDKFTVELALAGYSKTDLTISTKEGTLYIVGTKEAKTDERDYLYKGIAERSFNWSLKLPEFSEIKGVSLEEGILRIDIQIEIPEERKPKIYEIE